jgi:hypothetical protein
LHTETQFRPFRQPGKFSSSMKKIASSLFILLILIFLFTCSKNNNPDDNQGKDPVTDTISNSDTINNHEVTDTTLTGDDDDIPDDITDSTTVVDPDSINTGEVTDTIPLTVNKKDTLILSFQYGEDGPSPDWKNIYVVWLEAPGFIQNMYVCRKLIAGGLTNTALPYWKVNKYPLSSTDEIDAVTAATKANTDFTITTILKDTTLKNLTINFETDRSFDPNDWFDNQPAILYSASINLDDTLSIYELLPVGWTPNEGTENIVANTPMGKLQNEMGYISNYKKGAGFGEKDPRGASKMVKKITVTFK